MNRPPDPGKCNHVSLFIDRFLYSNSEIARSAPYCNDLQTLRQFLLFVTAKVEIDLRHSLSQYNSIRHGPLLCNMALQMQESCYRAVPRSLKHQLTVLTHPSHTGCWWRTKRTNTSSSDAHSSGRLYSYKASKASVWSVRAFGFQATQFRLRRIEVCLDNRQWRTSRISQIETLLRSCLAVNLNGPFIDLYIV